jgi:anti-anti-sigma factor
MNSTSIIKIKKELDGNKPVLLLEKELIYDNIQAVKDELTKFMEYFKEFSLELTNIENMDLNGIQLLHALKTKLQDQVNIKIRKIKDELKNIIDHSGFEYIF